MNRKVVAICFSMLLLGGACLLAGPALLAKAARAEDKPAESQPANVITIKGTCTFGGTKSTWSAKLTPRKDGAYDTAYDATWSGKTLKYVGTIKTDLKTRISGTGKASGGGANGSFEFSGKFDADGVAKCTYKEIRGGRSGTMTAELAK